MQLLTGARCVQLSAGAEHSMLLTDTGSVMVTGSLLRDTTALVATKPVLLGDTTGGGVRRVVSGGYHVLFEAADEGVGTELRPSSASSQRLRRSSSVDVVAPERSGRSLSVRGRAYASDSKFKGGAEIASIVLYSFGRGDRGALGHGNLEHLASPKVVEASRACGVRRVSAGVHHTLMISDAGWVFACGDNRSGQLGLGSDRRKIVHTLAMMRSLLTQEGHPASKRSSRDESDVPMLQVSAGTSHTVLLNQAGDVYVCGRNKFGELGIGDLARKDVARPTLLGIATSHMDRMDLQLRVQQEARTFVRRKYEALESARAAADASSIARNAMRGIQRTLQDMDASITRERVQKGLSKGVRPAKSETSDRPVPRPHEPGDGAGACACAGCVVS
eukprot:g3636.t1